VLVPRELLRNGGQDMIPTVAVTCLRGHGSRLVHRNGIPLGAARSAGATVSAAAPPDGRRPR
jgi:hypothetical protein